MTIRHCIDGGSLKHERLTDLKIILCLFSIEHVVRDKRLVTATTKWPDRKREKKGAEKEEDTLFS